MRVNRVLLVAALLLGVSAWSQITTGSLSGTVSDPAGAVIAGAKVTVRNQDTGQVTSLVANEVGLFKASYLTPGKYTVRVEAPGFRTTELKDIDVLLSREAVTNVMLQVGAVTETIEVQASAPLV